MTNQKAKAKLQLSNPIHLLATGFGSGLAPLIPGTIGTIAAIPFYWLMVNISVWFLILAIIVGTVLGIYLCDRASKDMGVHDHGSIVWDEFIGFWITMAIYPSLSWQAILAGFVIFRMFDMLKPWPISWFDTRIHGGLGIMLDDIIAGIMASLCLWAGHHYLAWW